MSGRDLNADLNIGAAKVHAQFNNKTTQHWKYPATVGNDTVMDDINFNSHQSSEFAIARSNHISSNTQEPFMLFEFMTIDETLAMDKLTKGSEQIGQLKNVIAGGMNAIVADTEEFVVGTADTVAAAWMNRPTYTKEETVAGLNSAVTAVRGWVKDAATPAERNYTGSIALYMPTDIQISDSMVYNEDTRKLGAALNQFATDGANGELINWVTLTDPAVLAAAGAAAGMIPSVPAALTAVITGTIGTLIQAEMQRHTGKVMNPNELVRYSQTALRSFTFNWTILPDSEHESDQAAGLIKFFRKSAHAKKSSDVMLTVPDHCVVSFHGAKDMIQLPACFIETVNVTYNPNNTSFFKRNNAPVEIGLSVGLKEIVPIYADDVERGY
jgi:hypothetical protein